MAKRFDRLPLLPSSPATRRHLLVHRYGQPGARPKAYLQASLHADEIPPMLVQHHLVGLLDQADREGRILGEVLVVPMANPIGVGQVLNGALLGRYELGGGGNFNRNWPDLADGLAEAVRDRLSEDPAANVAVVRSALGEALARRTATTEMASLRLALARLAYDADIVLDLHCDNEALVHLFLVPAHWPDAADLAAEVGSRATLLAADSGGHSFDETFSTPWTQLAAQFAPDRPIPPACLSATVEYRGTSDVEDALAAADAAALLRFLQRRRVVAGDPGPLPKALCAATRLDAVDIVRSPGAGLLAYREPLGAAVREGTVIAELVDPAAEDPRDARSPIRAATDGLLLSRRLDRLVRPGDTVAKVVGTRPLPSRQGLLLED